MISPDTRYHRAAQAKAARGESTLIRVGSLLSGSHYNGSTISKSETRATLIAELEVQRRARLGITKP